MRFFCTKCAKAIGDAYKPFCECGGMVEVGYDPARVHLADSGNPYARFADLLPVASTRDKFPGDATYSPTLHARALGAQAPAQYSAARAKAHDHQAPRRGLRNYPGQPHRQRHVIERTPIENLFDAPE